MSGCAIDSGSGVRMNQVIGCTDDLILQRTDPLLQRLFRENEAECAALRR
jgi:hypothetical protein